MTWRLLLFFFLHLSLFDVNAQTGEDDIAIKEVNRLYDRGNSLINTGQYDSALVVLKYTLDYAKEKLGEEHALPGDIAHSIGYVLMIQDHSADATSYYLEALKIKNSIYIPPNASLAMTLNGLGITYEDAGEFELAEKYYIEARTNWAGSFGKDHLQYSWPQHNLGKLYNKLGRDQEAVECLTDALRVKQANLPVDDPDLGHTLVFLSSALYQLGDYAGYEACGLRAAEIWKKQKGTNDQLYYWSRHNLALMQENLGHYDEAKSLALEALQGKIAYYQDQYHQDVATTLTLLANIYAGMLQYDSANYYLLHAKEIYEANHLFTIEYSWVLNNLGLNFNFLGNFEKAIEYLGKAMELKRSLIGTANTDYGSTLLNYARVLIYKNHLDTAQILLEQQKLFYEQQDLTLNEHYVTCLDLLGDVQIRHQNMEAAIHTFQRVNRIYRETIPQISGYSSENELFSYLKIAEYYLDKYLSLAFTSSEMTEDDRLDVSNQVLFFKSFLLEKYIEIRNQVSWDSASLNLYHELNVQKKLLAKQLVKIPSARQDTKRIEDKITSLEREISQSVPLQNKQASGADSIQAVLKRKEVAIEFVSYRYFMPDEQDSTFYSAILMHPSHTAPVLIPLFEARQLTKYITDTLQHGSGNVNQLYAGHGQALYDMIWAPLLPYLSNIQTIYFSSSGLLHRINFNAIPIAGNQVLGDEYDLIQLITTSQLLIPEPASPTNDNCTLIGGIYYEVDTTTNHTLAMDDLKMLHAGLAQADLPESTYTLRGRDWSYLRGSDAEIEQIHPLFLHAGLKASIWKGHTATEEQFKTLTRSNDRDPSPRIIHLSTHGYFYPDPFRNTTMTMPGTSVDYIKTADNPMIRSGLILAGGNYAWKNAKPYRPWMEDGILTAYEIVPMDLSDTELVVLSACETGLGDIDGNEGVYGLQRAFKIAGVRYIMMSLWQVTDAATVELMSRFYTHLLQHKQPVRKSLFLAQQEMRAEGYEPFEWAGFILIE